MLPVFTPSSAGSTGVRCHVHGNPSWHQNLGYVADDPDQAARRIDGVIGQCRRREDAGLLGHLRRLKNVDDLDNGSSPSKAWISRSLLASARLASLLKGVYPAETAAETE